MEVFVARVTGEAAGAQVTLRTGRGVFGQRPTVLTHFATQCAGFGGQWLRVADTDMIVQLQRFLEAGATFQTTVHLLCVGLSVDPEFRGVLKELSTHCANMVVISDLRHGLRLEVDPAMFLEQIEVVKRDAASVTEEGTEAVVAGVAGTAGGTRDNGASAVCSQVRVFATRVFPQKTYVPEHFPANLALKRGVSSVNARVRSQGLLAGKADAAMLANVRS